MKWVVEEEYADLAEALLRGSMAVDVPLMAPPHFSGEVVNALYQRIRRRGPGVELIEAKASQAVERFLAFEVKSVAPEGLYGAAFAFTRDHRLANIYDALYVTLARMAEADLWTADLTLLRAVGSALGAVDRRIPAARPVGLTPTFRTTAGRTRAGQWTKLSAAGMPASCTKGGQIKIIQRTREGKPAPKSRSATLHAAAGSSPFSLRVRCSVQLRRWRD